jgi:hypothetical protein
MLPSSKGSYFAIRDLIPNNSVRRSFKDDLGGRPCDITIKYPTFTSTAQSLIPTNATNPHLKNSNMASVEDIKTVSPVELQDFNPNLDDDPFTTFTSLQKRLITFSASFAAMFSGLSSFIYYPTIVPLSTSLGVSTELINLTLTSYFLEVKHI